MEALWFWLLASMLAIYATLDGLDFGVGMLHFVVARTAAERETLLHSIGPIWDGNEVWLIAAGGTAFAAFPALYATVFSGFYLPLMLVLWLLLFRALGIELRHHSQNPLWHQLWDVAFSASSLLLALVFGAALANLVRGLPLDAAGQFFEPLWTDFRLGAQTGILDWYTLLVGLTAVAALAHHGALWLNLKTSGELAERSRHCARNVWPAAVLLTLATSASSAVAQPHLLQNLSRVPAIALLPLLALAGLALARASLERNPRRAVWGSAAFVLGLVLSAACAIFPQALAGRSPGAGLTLTDAAARPETLRAMLFWWLPGIALAGAYSFFVYSRVAATTGTTEEH